MGIRTALAVVSLLTVPVLFAWGCGSPVGFGGDGGPDGNDVDAAHDVTVQFPDVSSESASCVNLQCQVQNCGGGVSTTIDGTVYAPNGTLPLYNVVVYVPNAPLDPIKHGVSCDQCGASVSGNPIVVTSTDAKGHFSLANVPSGSNIPLVLQVGKWRRQITIPTVNACQPNNVGQQVSGVEQLTRLPKNQTEGDIPYIAITTGGCEHFACLIPKLGLDSTEFAAGPTSTTTTITKAFSFYNASSGTGPSSWPAASSLWNNLSLLEEFDMVMFSCECYEPPDANATSYQAVLQYLNAGGRVFGTDFMYVWYKDSSDMDMNSSPWSWPGGAPGGTDPLDIDTTFPKGQALADWMYNLSTIAPFNAAGVFVAPVINGQFHVEGAAGGVVYANIDAINTKYGLEWTHSGGHPNIVTIGTPTAQPPAMQCGKGVHLDIHVEQSNDTVGPSYPVGCSNQLHEPDFATTFFFFDIASCIQDDTQPIILPN
jgi:hypothetical protein